MLHRGSMSLFLLFFELTALLIPISPTRCPESIYCCFCRCCITETAVENVEQFADIHGAAGSGFNLDPQHTSIGRALSTPNVSPKPRSPIPNIIQPDQPTVQSMNEGKITISPDHPDPAQSLRDTLPHFVTPSHTHCPSVSEGDISRISPLPFPCAKTAVSPNSSSESDTSPSSCGSQGERVIARFSWCGPPHPDLPDSPRSGSSSPSQTDTERTYPVDPDLTPNYSFDSKASMKSSGILKMKSIIKDPGDGADSSDDSIWKTHRPPARSRFLSKSVTWTCYSMESKMSSKCDLRDFVDPRSPPNGPGSGPNSRPGSRPGSPSRSIGPRQRSYPSQTSWKGPSQSSWKGHSQRSVQSIKSQSSFSRYSLVYSDCCSSASSKVSETSSPAFSTMHQQFVSTREIPSQDKLISPIDCEGIIDMIPFGTLSFNESFWDQLGVSNRDQIRQFLVDKCLDRFHDLYDETLDDIQIRYHPEADPQARCPNTTRNLVVLNLEKTVLNSDIPTPNVNGSRLAKYNRRDLMLQFIGNTQEITDEFGGATNQLVMVRAGLMELLYSTLPRKIGDNIFDFIVYADGGTNDAFHNAVAIEMYFNWYYLMIRDPNITVAQHQESVFDFKFIMTYSPHRDGDGIKKSLDALHLVMGDAIEQFHRVLVIDSNIHWWDHRLPRKCRHIWNTVLPIKLPRFNIVTAGKSLKAMAAQRKQDRALKYLKRFLVEIDKQFQYIMERTLGFLIMNWIEFDGEKVRIVKLEELQHPPGLKRLNSTNTRKSRFKHVQRLDKAIVSE